MYSTSNTRLTSLTDDREPRDYIYLQLLSGLHYTPASHSISCIGPTVVGTRRGFGLKITHALLGENFR